VEDLLRRVTARISAQDRVFCVLDRATRDNTMERVRRFSAADPRVVLVWAPENRCVVDAYLRGYREALDGGCGWILEMDGGLSHLPEEIPRFLEAMESGVDFAAGSRFGPGGRYQGRGSRYLLSRGGTLLANLLLGTRMKDMTSGFECFTDRALRHVLSVGVRSRRHFFQTEIRYLLRDFPWVEVPISYANPSKRTGKESVMEALRNLWWLRSRSRGERSPEGKP
jgi:dolichol-phosphate mannosyltransferase